MHPQNFYLRLRSARKPAAKIASTDTPGSGITGPAVPARAALRTPAALGLTAPVADIEPRRRFPELASTLAANYGASAAKATPVSTTKR